MVRPARLLLALALVGGSLPLPGGYAQTADAPVMLLLPVAAPPAPTTPAPSDGEPAFLRTLPRPPEQPRSLFEPAGPVAHHPPEVKPYFQQDPLLDPVQLPAVGCFADVEVGLLKPHVKNGLFNTVQLGAGAPDRVQLGSAALDWTVSPSFEVGYRLPAGFGEVSLAYRFLVSQGSDTFPGPDGPAARRSRLDLNQVNLDYASREFSLWPHWQMKWHVGLRYVYLYFDTRADEPSDLAAAGTGVFERRISNSFVGIGPHAGVELARRLDDCCSWLGLNNQGFALVARVDGATLLGRIRQGFFEVGTSTGPDGLPLTGETRISGSQDVPMLNAQAGLSWQPYPDFFFFLGYQFEYWWSVGRFDGSRGSNAYLVDQGLFVQALFNF